MTISTVMTKSLMIAAVTAAVAGFTVSANAADNKPATEKCYGVAKAGKNDCGGRGSKCAGHAAKDGEGFVALPKGVCERLAGGSLTE